MIQQQGDQLKISGPLTAETVPKLYEQGKKLLSQQDCVVDLSAVETIDSSAVSLLLGWTRQAKNKQRRLVFCNLPTQLQSLATLYGVAEMLPINSNTTNN